MNFPKEHFADFELADIILKSLQVQAALDRKVSIAYYKYLLTGKTIPALKRYFLTSEEVKNAKIIGNDSRGYYIEFPEAHVESICSEYVRPDDDSLDLCRELNQIRADYAIIKSRTPEDYYYEDNCSSNDSENVEELEYFAGPLLGGPGPTTSLAGFDVDDLCSINGYGGNNMFRLCDRDW